MKIPITPGRIESRTVLNLNPGWVRIEQVCANAWEIPVEWISQRTKAPRIAFPRMLSMRLLRNRHNWTFQRIADHYHKDPTSVMCCIRRINELEEVDSEIRQLVQAAERAL